MSQEESDSATVHNLHIPIQRPVHPPTPPPPVAVKEDWVPEIVYTVVSHDEC